MLTNQRIQELERRVQSDPSSVAFAALAEEYRRLARFDDAIDVCRRGLGRYPTSLSARVTLGRALIALNRLAEAEVELQQVFEASPENLAAIRALADIHRLREEGVSEVVPPGSHPALPALGRFLGRIVAARAARGARPSA